MIRSHAKISFESKLKNIGGCYGLNYVSPKKIYWTSNPCLAPPPIPQNGDLCGDGAFTEVIKLK